MSECNSTVLNQYRKQLNSMVDFSSMKEDDPLLWDYYYDLSIEQSTEGKYVNELYFEDWMRYFYMKDLIEKVARLIPLVHAKNIGSCTEQERAYILGAVDEVLSKEYYGKDPSLYNKEAIERLFSAIDDHKTELLNKWRSEQ